MRLWVEIESARRNKRLCETGGKDPDKTPSDPGNILDALDVLRAIKCLEDNLQPHLHLSGAYALGKGTDLASRRLIEQPLRCAKTHDVKNIERFGTELHTDSLPQGYVLEQGKVYVSHPVSAKDISTKATVRKHRN